MKASVLSIALLGAIPIPLVAADFSIYMTKSTTEVANAGDEVSRSWQIFEDEGECAPWYQLWIPKSDVSGGNLGVRCSGSGCDYLPSPGDIDVLEMNFSNNPVLHWTLYKTGNWDMIGLDGNVYGSCKTDPGADVDCGDQYGYRKFFCTTSHTAQEINPELH